MATAKLNQQDLSERLRRRLGLAGNVEPELELKTTISLDAGSLFEPGLSVFKGRRFACALSTAVTGAASALQLQPQVDCVFTGFRFQCTTTAGSITVGYGTLVGAANRNSIFLESPPSGAAPEVPPIFDTGIIQAGLPASNGAAYIGVIKDQVVDFPDGGILIRGQSGGLQGFTINVSAALAAGYAVTVFGYVARL